MEKIDFLFRQVFSSCLSNKTTAAKIKVSALLSYLVGETPFQETQLRLLLGQISQPLTDKIDPWSRPLISSGEFYYFLLPTIVFGALSKKLDPLIDQHLSRNRQCTLLKELIRIELSPPNANASIVQIDIQATDLPLRKDNLLIYAVGSKLLIIEAVVFQYCLTPIEYFNELRTLASANEILQNNKEIILANLNSIISSEITHIIPILVPNHYRFSGLMLDGSHVLDNSLLKNYIIKGKHSRNILTSDSSRKHDNQIAEFSYYADKESFEDNLKDYCYYPTPITEIINSLAIKEYKISPLNTQPSFFLDGVVMDKLKDTIKQNIDQLEYYLRQLYYFEKDYKEEEHSDTKDYFEKRISYLLPIAFNYYALDKSDRISRVRLLNIFSDIGISGMVHLIYSLNSQIQQLSRKPIDRDIKSEPLDIDHEKAQQHFEQIVEKFKKTGVSISTIEIQHNLSDKDRNNLIGHLFILASRYSPKKYDDDDIFTFHFILVYVSNLAAGIDKYEDNLYSVFANFIDLLNFNGKYQLARDVAEETLAFSFKNEIYPLLGWLCQFKCFSQQKNVLDAAFYGTLLFATLNAMPEIKYHQGFDAVYNALIFFRNYGYTDIAESLYKSLLLFDLSEYDLQKVTLSYYNSKLEEQKEVGLLLADIETFLDEHIAQIVEYKQQGCLPWLNFLYNLLNFEQKGLVTLSAKLNGYVSLFEKHVDLNTLEKLKGTFFTGGIISENLLIESLMAAHETRGAKDFSSEISNLEMLANTVIRSSIDPVRLNALLLAGLVINDSSISFIEKPAVQSTRLFVDEDKSDKSLKQKFQQYADFILPNLTLEKGQLICWIFEFENKVCCLYIDHYKAVKVLKQPGWDMKVMRAWIEELDKFYFDDIRASINEQEQNYVKALNELSFSVLSPPFNFDELLIYTSLELAGFPLNLLLETVQSEKEISELHPDHVKDNIKTELLEFISFNHPVTNILSLEWFEKMSTLRSLKLSDLKLKAWVPLDDEDMALRIAYTRLEPVLSEFKCVIQTELVPNPKLDGIINFIAAHGDKGNEGFKAVHTREDDASHAFINGLGTELVFGSGLIAIVFICNSGFQSKEAYAQKLTSFINRLLSLGYEAVVAPAWKFNPEMCKVWTTGFLNAITEGKKLSFAVQAANKNTSQEGFDDNWGFYEPQGWAIMHLYGNPNIYFR